MSAADTERVFKNQDDLLLLDAEAAAELVTKDEAAEPGEDIALEDVVETAKTSPGDDELTDEFNDSGSYPGDNLDIELDDATDETFDADDAVENDALVDQAPPLSPIAVVALTATVIVLLVTIGIEIYGLASINFKNAHQAAELENSNDSYLDVKALESDPNVDKD